MDYCNLNEVIDEFYNYIKNFTIKKVGDKSLADDIVQEVMRKLIESHHRSKPIENTKAWLFQVTRNTIYDYIMKNPKTFDPQDNPPLTLKESAEFELTVHDFILPMIRFLPRKYADPLYWSDIDNLSQLEIAERLNISHSAAKMRVQRARAKLRELFVECCIIEYDSKGNFLTCNVKESCTPLIQHLNDFEESL